MMDAIQLAINIGSILASACATAVILSWRLSKEIATLQVRMENTTSSLDKHEANDQSNFDDIKRGQTNMSNRVDTQFADVKGEIREIRGVIDNSRTELRGEIRGNAQDMENRLAKFATAAISRYND